MFSASAEFYDLIYSTFKDYIGEAEQIAGLLRQLNLHCQTVLDVACGTGEHARLLAGHGFVVDGIDLGPAFVRIAEQKHPAGRFFVADIVDDLPPLAAVQRRAVLLFRFYRLSPNPRSSTLRAFTCFAQSHHGGRHHRRRTLVCSRQTRPDARCTTDGRGERGSACLESVVWRLKAEISRLHFDYGIRDPTGTRHASGRFTHWASLPTAELLQVFQEAGLQADHHPKGLTDRGLYLARIP